MTTEEEESIVKLKLLWDKYVNAHLKVREIEESFKTSSEWVSATRHCEEAWEQYHAEARRAKP